MSDSSQGKRCTHRDQSYRKENFFSSIGIYILNFVTTIYNFVERYFVFTNHN